MKQLALSGLACATFLFVFADYAFAHGGQFRGGRYRGPGDVVPPDTGGGGTPTPEPTALAMFTIGMLSLGAWRIRKRRRIA